MRMYLRARVIEGTDVWHERGSKGAFNAISNDVLCIEAPCNQKGFDALYNVGKMLWDKDMCSKFEIAAFCGGELFWKTRPDQWNFEHGRYDGWFDSMIAEELQSFQSEDFQCDELELGYLQGYQDKFWKGRHEVCSVEAFLSLVKNTQLCEDLKYVRDWVDKMEAEVPLDVLSNMSFVPRECGFSFNGQWIVNPFYSETLRFGVEPLKHYGEENIKGYLERMKKMILGQEHLPLGKQIQSAANSKPRDEQVADMSAAKKDIERE